MTYKKFIREWEKKALSLGKEDAAVIIYLLHVSKLTSSQLYLHINDEVDLNIVEEFEDGFNKYLYENKPIQYLVGTQTFYGYDFIVDERVLIPRFETEELVENVLMLYDEYFAPKKVSVADVGTGSGAIGISLALEEKNMDVTITDISEDALAVAKANIEKFKVKVTALQGDMVEPLKGKKFDIIVSNPPYIPSNENVESLVKDNEPNIALFGGDDGLKFYRIILANVSSLLNEKALIAFEHGFDKSEKLKEEVIKYFPNAKIIQKKDLQGKDRMTFVLVGDFDESK